VIKGLIDENENLKEENESLRRRNNWLTKRLADQTDLFKSTQKNQKEKQTESLRKDKLATEQLKRWYYTISDLQEKSLVAFFRNCSQSSFSSCLNNILK
jgi:regulator of replication initiation timing